MREAMWPCSAFAPRNCPTGFSGLRTDTSTCSGHEHMQKVAPTEDGPHATSSSLWRMRNGAGGATHIEYRASQMGWLPATLHVSVAFHRWPRGVPNTFMPCIVGGSSEPRAHPGTGVWSLHDLLQRIADIWLHTCRIPHMSLASLDSDPSAGPQGFVHSAVYRTNPIGFGHHVQIIQESKETPGSPPFPLCGPLLHRLPTCTLSAWNRTNAQMENFAANFHSLQAEEHRPP